MFGIQINPDTRQLCEDITGGAVPAYQRGMILVVDKDDNRVLTIAEFKAVAEDNDLVPETLTIWK